MRMGLALTMMAALALPGCSSATETTATAATALRSVPLTIGSTKGIHRFTVEIAESDEEQARGMMFRPVLAPDRGMIFPFAQPRVASFWMKNCPHPLDMVFIRADGSIARIVTAIPYSEQPETSGEPVAAVLEIAGGRAAELGIAEDDKVAWQAR
jgi:uncharacterized protein